MAKSKHPPSLSRERQRNIDAFLAQFHLLAPPEWNRDRLLNSERVPHRYRWRTVESRSGQTTCFASLLIVADRAPPNDVPTIVVPGDLWFEQTLTTTEIYWRSDSTWEVWEPEDHRAHPLFKHRSLTYHPVRQDLTWVTPRGERSIAESYAGAGRSKKGVMLERMLGRLLGSESNSENVDAETDDDIPLSHLSALRHRSNGQLQAVINYTEEGALGSNLSPLTSCPSTPSVSDDLRRTRSTLDNSVPTTNLQKNAPGSSPLDILRTSTQTRDVRLLSIKVEPLDIMVHGSTEDVAVSSQRCLSSPAPRGKRRPVRTPSPHSLLKRRRAPSPLVSNSPRETPRSPHDPSRDSSRFSLHSVVGDAQSMAGCSVSPTGHPSGKRRSILDSEYERGVSYLSERVEFLGETVAGPMDSTPSNEKSGAECSAYDMNDLGDRNTPPGEDAGRNRKVLSVSQGAHSATPHDRAASTNSLAKAEVAQSLHSAYPDYTSRRPPKTLPRQRSSCIHTQVPEHEIEQIQAQLSAAQQELQALRIELEKRATALTVAVIRREESDAQIERLEHENRRLRTMAEGFTRGQRGQGLRRSGSVESERGPDGCDGAGSWSTHGSRATQDLDKGLPQTQDGSLSILDQLRRYIEDLLHTRDVEMQSMEDSLQAQGRATEERRQSIKDQRSTPSA
ncbi:hypothetical protein CERSUDRAFT_116867 [Gelatoporia subvermispora B]|uniref:Uncharacterized protein n=1 Tax=Ceriporiopsis subvermispora (strain B) TaxID=914234 RepID=M2QCC9_CERS8|nr:hypothetical protein CERSUDRAFT_116867 [Gelatoporia subvermispora B]